MPIQSIGNVLRQSQPSSSGGQVSKQTVMRKIREAQPAVKLVLRQKVPVLHAKADKDHVRLQTGDRRIAPHWRRDSA